MDDLVVHVNIRGQRARRHGLALPCRGSQGNGTGPPRKTRQSRSSFVVSVGGLGPVTIWEWADRGQETSNPPDSGKMRGAASASGE